MGNTLNTPLQLWPPQCLRHHRCEYLRNTSPTFSILSAFPSTTMNSKLVAEWSAYNVALYSTQRPPPLGTVDTVEKLEKLAREHLIKVASEGVSNGGQFSIKLSGSSGAFLYVFGSAGVWKTYEANRKAFDKWAIIPRMLRNCTARNLEVSTTFHLNCALSDRGWAPDNHLRSQAQSSDTIGSYWGSGYPPSRG